MLLEVGTYSAFHERKVLTQLPQKNRKVYMPLGLFICNVKDVRVRSDLMVIALGVLSKPNQGMNYSSLDWILHLVERVSEREVQI